MLSFYLYQLVSKVCWNNTQKYFGFVRIIRKYSENIILMRPNKNCVRRKKSAFMLRRRRFLYDISVRFICVKKLVLLLKAVHQNIFNCPFIFTFNWASIARKLDFNCPNCYRRFLKRKSYFTHRNKEFARRISKYTHQTIYTITSKPRWIMNDTWT